MRFVLPGISAYSVSCSLSSVEVGAGLVRLKGGLLLILLWSGSSLGF